MAVETELYIAYPEEYLEHGKVAPAIITTDLDVINAGMEALQEAASATKMIFRVIKVTEAEFVFKITPEEQEEEVDEDLMTQIGNVLNNTTNAPF